MECKLAALLACFSWSGFYVDGGLSYQDVGIPHQEYVTRVFQEGGVTTEIIQLETIDDPVNPYGWLALGYELNLGSFRFALEGRHAVSSMRIDGDDGINSIDFGVRWYPFRR